MKALFFVKSKYEYKEDNKTVLNFILKGYCLLFLAVVASINRGKPAVPTTSSKNTVFILGAVFATLVSLAAMKSCVGNPHKIPGLLHAELTCWRLFTVRICGTLGTLLAAFGR